MILLPPQISPSELAFLKAQKDAFSHISLQQSAVALISTKSLPMPGSDQFSTSADPNLSNWNLLSYLVERVRDPEFRFREPGSYRRQVGHLQYTFRELRKKYPGIRIVKEGDDNDNLNHNAGTKSNLFTDHGGNSHGVSGGEVGMDGDSEEISDVSNQNDEESGGCAACTIPLSAESWLWVQREVLKKKPARF
jgi:hypothetical protein